MRNENIKFKIHMTDLKAHDKKFVNTLIPKNIKFSKHAIDQQKTRNIDINTACVKTFFTVKHIIDIQVTNDNKVKFLVRFPYDNKNDIVLAIAQNGVICTNWLNNKYDKHATLKDKHLYTKNLNLLKAII